MRRQAQHWRLCRRLQPAAVQPTIIGQCPAEQRSCSLLRLLLWARRSVYAVAATATAAPGPTAAARLAIVQLLLRLPPALWRQVPRSHLLQRRGLLRQQQRRRRRQPLLPTRQLDAQPVSEPCRQDASSTRQLLLASKRGWHNKSLVCAGSRGRPASGCADLAWGSACTASGCLKILPAHGAPPARRHGLLMGFTACGRGAPRSC